MQEQAGNTVSVTKTLHLPGDRNPSVRTERSYSKPIPKKSPIKGHEAFLKALETAGVEITIDMLGDPDGDRTVIGKIKTSDKYTISIDGTDDVTVVFKNAIETITVPKAKAKTEAA